MHCVYALPITINSAANVIEGASDSRGPREQSKESRSKTVKDMTEHRAYATKTKALVPIGSFTCIQDDYDGCFRPVRALCEKREGIINALIHVASFSG